MFINELGVTIAAKKNAEIVERCHDAGQLDAVDKENSQRNLLLANSVQEKILQVLRTFRHGADSFFFARMGGQEINNQ